jgi:hypothetical protein
MREIRAAIRRQDSSRANCAKSKGFPFQLKQRHSIGEEDCRTTPSQAIVISVPPD